MNQTPPRFVGGFKNIRVIFALTTITTVFADVSLLNKSQDNFRKDFNVPTSRFMNKGKSLYFVLEPGYRQTFQGKEKGGSTDLIITVLDRTETIDGVETRVIEEKESLNGQLVEISRNFFVIDEKNKDVYYFGEEVDIYENGKIKNHDGSWKSGVNGAHYGLFVAGNPKVGDSYFQELAPGNALDQATHTSKSKTVKTLAGTFKNCLVVKETTPLEPGVVAWKTYAPGVGLIVDGDLRLTSFKKTK